MNVIALSSSQKLMILVMVAFDLIVTKPYTKILSLVNQPYLYFCCFVTNIYDVVSSA